MGHHGTSVEKQSWFHAPDWSVVSRASSMGWARNHLQTGTVKRNHADWKTATSRWLQSIGPYFQTFQHWLKGQNQASTQVCLEDLALAVWAEIDQELPTEYLSINGKLQGPQTWKQSMDEEKFWFCNNCFLIPWHRMAQQRLFSTFSASRNRFSCSCRKLLTNPSRKT